MSRVAVGPFQIPLFYFVCLERTAGHPSPISCQKKREIFFMPENGSWTSLKFEFAFLLYSFFCLEAQDRAKLWSRLVIKLWIAMSQSWRKWYENFILSSHVLQGGGLMCVATVDGDSRQKPPGLSMNSCLQSMHLEILMRLYAISV